MTLAMPSDEVQWTHDMMRRLRGGDPRPFNLLFERHFEPLTRLVARMVDSRHVAAELVQDVFLRLWRRRSTLEIRGDWYSYLRRAARNRALDWLRREDLHREWERTAAQETQLDAGDSQDMEQEELARRHLLLAEILSAMPERRRAVCELRWRVGLGPSAIAERLGVSVKTVETHITRGFKDARAELLGRGT
jgi:RNA polymerase sigma-70 factor (ECF subfamily)